MISTAVTSVPRFSVSFRKPTSIRKRNGKIVPFDEDRIVKAVSNCYASMSISRQPDISPSEVALKVVNILAVKAYDSIPDVEKIQDIVEQVLLSAGEYEAAKRYIIYRHEHAKIRGDIVPEEIKSIFKADEKYFEKDPLRQFQFYDKYSRWNYQLGRRETWIETVDRAVSFLKELVDSQRPGAIPDTKFEEIRQGILKMEVTPSMRLLAMAGDAARRQNLSIYNCSYLPVKDTQCFVEALLISMAGCGVGYSVEREYVEQFPRIKRRNRSAASFHQIEDSTEGWAEALQKGLDTWMEGGDIEFNYDLIRPAGAPLKTKGGQASGPGPLRDMLNFIREIIFSRQGRFLRPIDAHDIMTKVGDAAVMGGTRRTAMICLFDWDDKEIANCKNCDLEAIGRTNRWNANNSAVWPEDIDQNSIIRQMLEMSEAGTGEPGIFSRENANRTKPKNRKKADFGSNPCGEINLRPFGLCNLSACVARSYDTPETLERKVRLASLIGTIQSLATYFPGMREEWKKNCEEERLLGVDITGQRDCPILNGDLFDNLREAVIDENNIWADALGINRSASVTCVKPSGNTSTLVNCSSGLHARQFPYYLRRVRIMSTNPIFKIFKEVGIHMDPENGQNPDTATTWVVGFPVKSPDGSITNKDLSAIDQLNWWLTNKLHWTTHNPSCTIAYKKNEMTKIIDWVWEHRQKIGGLSFLPMNEHVYNLAPYEEITKEQYEELISKFPEIDYSRIYAYEKEDRTTASQELACMAGQCELI